jgi:putative transposase
MSYEFSGGYKIRDQSATHFLTFTIMGWIDIFSRQIYKDILLDCLDHCRKYKHLKVGAYVIMTNHAHFIWRTSSNNLSGIIRDFKSFSSKKMLEEIQKENESRRHWLLYMFNFYAQRTNNNKFFKIWTGDNHPEEIHSQPFMMTKLNYIHNNPVRAGIVAESSHYLYSSAANYEGKKGLIDIVFLY